ncbi:hypothetical protein Thermo_01275 [Thermoplasmatales archaeon]|nr:hypothetical protein Thermo_01275 [Thermoplasmatales archaeon]
MTSELEIRSAISNNRKVSEDGGLVTYDLTKGVNFIKPRVTAEALAAVFFETDAIKWFSVSDDKIEFTPTYKVRIVLAEDDNKKLEETADDFMADLKRGELYHKFEQQVKKDSVDVSKMRTAMATGAINSMITKHFGKRLDRDYVEDDLLTDILENIEIRSLSNKDLIDWQHLPL